MSGDFFLTTWFFLAMRWLCENVVNNSVFLTILISTVVLRLLTLVSDIKQRKTTAKMAVIQPKLDKLKEQYKNDPQRFQQENQKLMKENNISPFAGCLPLLITIPLLFCFIAAFRFWGCEQNVKMAAEMSENISVAMRERGFADKDADNAECVEIFAEKIAETEKIEDAAEKKAAYKELYKDIKVSETFLQAKFLWINNIWQPDNGLAEVVIPAKTFFGANYKSTKKLIYFNDHPEVKRELTDLGLFYDERDTYADVGASGEILEQSDVKKSGLTYKELDKTQQQGLKATAEARYSALMAPLEYVYDGYNNGWFILPVLATLFQVLLVLYTQKQQKESGMAQAQGGGTGKFMLYLMPALSFIFCLSYTAAFAMYWTLSSICMLVVNIILSKTIKTETAKK